jgi:hypothetical protein
VSRASDDEIRRSLMPALEPGEQLRAVGVFYESRAHPDWRVGITDNRLLVATQGWATEENVEHATFAVALEHVELQRNPTQLQLRLASADPKVPKLLISQVGKQTRDEFKKLVANRRTVASGVSDDQIRVSLTSALEPDEQLRAVGLFFSKWGVHDWCVGITDKRLIVAKQGWGTEKLVDDEMFTVPLENVGVVRGSWYLRLRLGSPDPKGPRFLGSPDPKVPRLLISRKGGKKKRDEFKKFVTNSSWFAWKAPGPSR